MFLYKCHKFFTAIVCFSLLLMMFTVQVFAEDVPEDPYLILTPEDPKNTEENILVGTLQKRLTELGYYAERNTYILDADTLFALSDFCTTNKLPFDEKGVRQSAWDALMSEDAIPAAGSAEYTFIPYGTESETVLALQIRLKDLQYYEGLVLVPEKYDEDLQKAIDRFCETNAISYDRSGITPAVQQLIYSQGAIPYTAPAEQRSLAEKFTAYMMQDADLLVIVVPVFVVWILIMFVVLIAAVFTMQRLQQKKAIKDANQGPQDTREIGAGKGSKNMPPPPVEMRKMIQFQIDYQGKTWNLEKDASCPLTIGRGNAEIRLDSSDRSASRKHCVLFFKGAVLMLQDVSVNGTYINDSVFHKCTTPVQSGDCIVIGSHHIFLRF